MNRFFSLLGEGSPGEKNRAAHPRGGGPPILFDRGEPLQAAALAFVPWQDGAPRVVASGKGHLADDIVRRAEVSGIPIVRDPELAALLQVLPPGTEIPVDLYRVVAGLFARIRTLDRDIKYEKDQSRGFETRDDVRSTRVHRSVERPRSSPPGTSSQRY